MHIFPIHEQYIKYFPVLRALYNSSMIKNRKISSVSFSKMKVNIVIFIAVVNLFPDTWFYLLLFIFTNQVVCGQLTEKERRKWFGYVEQSYHMVPGTIRDQITLYDESITEEQSWQNRRSCFWMRLLQTWMPRRNTRCCRHWREHRRTE